MILEAAMHIDIAERTGTDSSEFESAGRHFDL